METIRKYKSIKGLTLVFSLMALALSFNSCEQFDLNENPGASQLQAATYTNMAQLELGVTGVYGKLNKTTFMTIFHINAWGGDDLTTHVASNKADWREIDQRFINQDNPRLLVNWERTYEVIRAANSVLESVEGAVISDADPVEQERLIGEVYFIRAIMFYHMMRIHGEIPLVLEVDPFQQTELSSQLEVFQQIESDLLEAEIRVPVKSEYVGSTTPSKGTVKAFLARLYMDWAGFPIKDTGKYTQAATISKEVIDNASNHGFALDPDLMAMWTNEGRFTTEGVFTIAYSMSGTDTANRKDGRLGLPTDFGGWQETFAEIRFFEDMPEGLRKEATFYSSIPVDANGVITAGTPAKNIRWEEFKDQQSPLFRKTVGAFSDGDWQNYQTIRSDLFMRYSEVLLIYAEASGEAGIAGSEAWEALNMVHRRAQGLDFNTPAVNDFSASDGTIQDLAFTERKWEFAGEYIRWYDLVRKEKVEEVLSDRSPRVSIGTLYDANGVGTPKPLTTAQNPIIGSLGIENYYAPRPIQEIEKNPKLAN